MSTLEHKSSHCEPLDDEPHDAESSHRDDELPVDPDGHSVVRRAPAGRQPLGGGGGAEGMPEALELVDDPDPEPVLGGGAKSEEKILIISFSRLGRPDDPDDPDDPASVVPVVRAGRDNPPSAWIILDSGLAVCVKPDPDPEADPDPEPEVPHVEPEPEPVVELAPSPRPLKISIISVKLRFCEPLVLLVVQRDPDPDDGRVPQDPDDPDELGLPHRDPHVVVQDGPHVVLDPVDVDVDVVGIPLRARMISVRGLL